MVEEQTELFGFNDVPADEDLVSVNGYLQGLTDFIKKCQTPMTIAVQGDWGSGKTSAMKTLKNQLNESSKEKYWQIDFNTWQYSQFDLGDQLVSSLIGTILNQLTSQIRNEKLASETYKENALRIIRELSKPLLAGFSAALRLGVKSFVPAGGEIIEIADQMKESYKETVLVNEESESYGPNASISLITELREKLSEIVANVVKKDPENPDYIPPKRIIIYIDDLDRLEPEKAVVLMEAIKIFLDVPHCVFVLAIDFGVVLRGVRAKYGDDLTEDKARAFFDKIIQVPFNLPVGAYAVSELLQKGLESYQVEDFNEERSTFTELTESSVGRNPRSIKRLINTFGLIKTIGKQVAGNATGTDGNEMQNTAKDTHIFAILCMQTAYPEVFTELTRTRDIDAREEIWNEIVKITQEESSQTLKLPEKYGVSDYKTESFVRFIDRVVDLFKSKTGTGLNKELFNDALIKSAVTAVGTTETAGGQAVAPFKPSAIKDLQERYEKLEIKYKESSTVANAPNVPALMRAFEESFKEKLESVAAGDTGVYWSYEGTVNSKLHHSFVGKRFLELHYQKAAIAAQFGRYLSKERAEKVLKGMEDKFNGDDKNKEIGISRTPKSNPPYSVRLIKTEEQARHLATLIAKAYIDQGEVEPKKK